MQTVLCLRLWVARELCNGQSERTLQNYHFAHFLISFTATHPPSTPARSDALCVLPMIDHHADATEFNATQNEPIEAEGC